MPENIIWQGKNKAGKIFTMRGDLKELQKDINELVGINLEAVEGDEDWHDGYSLDTCHIDTDYKHPTAEERLKEVDQLKKVMAEIEEKGWMEVFLKLPRKKNGTLSKSRVTQLWRGDTFGHFWEDSYGFNAPELIVRNVGDYEAHIYIEHRTQGW